MNIAMLVLMNNFDDSPDLLLDLLLMATETWCYRILALCCSLNVLWNVLDIMVLVSNRQDIWKQFLNNLESVAVTVLDDARNLRLNMVLFSFYFDIRDDEKNDSNNMPSTASPSGVL